MIKILVIDDEAILLEELSENLIYEGFDVVSTYDSLNGVILAQQHLPDIILCDIMMPHLDGFGVLLELRSNPATAKIPFVFLTARAAREDWRKGMQMGADDYLTKPFQHTELLGVINTQLEKYAARKQEYAHQIDILHDALVREQEMRLLKSRFVSMVSHEFRNPLTTITSSNSLLRDYGDKMAPERRVIHLDRIDSAVQQLVNMLDDMLLVGSVETGTLDVKKSEFSLVELCDLLMRELRQMHDNTHELSFDCSYDGIVYADQKLLRYVLINLLTNALKYSPNGGQITLRILRKVDTIVIEVEDQGIGIPEADQMQIFEPFQRASNVGEIEGTGLGLSIVKQAIELHQGTIALDSRVPEGTIFTVTLPILFKGKKVHD